MKFGAILKQTDTPPFPNPGDMPEGTLRAILKQAGIEPGQFLED